jgi:hypothetical protein
MQYVSTLEAIVAMKYQHCSAGNVRCIKKLNTYRKSMRSAISDASTGFDGCEFLPKTSTIILKSNERV